MTKKIILKKATRIEGNANVEIEIERGRVKAARFVVYDFRGFEKFMQGRRVEHIPALVSRICGLCSVAHQVASLRAIEDALGIQVPRSIDLLRETMVLGEWIGSHSLSYFYLTLPDFMGSSGGFFELMQTHPEVAREAYELRKAGQRIVELLGKRATHPVSLTIGGFSSPLTAAELQEVGAIAATVKNRVKAFIMQADRSEPRESEIYFPADQQLNFLAYESRLNGKQFNAYDRWGNLTASFNYNEFSDHVAEMRADWSFAKFPYLERLGFPQGILLVGPLARSYQENGPLTDSELQELQLVRRLRDRTSLSLESVDSCRLLEIFWAAKRILGLLEDVSLDELGRVEYVEASGQGIGVLEAPRGTLIHSYMVNRGLLERAKLLVATQFNNAYINMLIRDLAEKHIEGNQLSQKGEWLIGHCIRLFDPCLSCATH
jgi:coenzyme F420-reducing hydrogenase alpha subunit